MEIPVEILRRLDDDGDLKNGALIFIIRAHAEGYNVTTIGQTEAGLNTANYAEWTGEEVERAVRGENQVVLHCKNCGEPYMRVFEDDEPYPGYCRPECDPHEVTGAHPFPSKGESHVL